MQDYLLNPDTTGYFGGFDDILDDLLAGEDDIDGNTLDIDNIMGGAIDEDMTLFQSINNFINISL